jgi:ABC-2 type transport system permease protein
MRTTLVIWRREFTAYFNSPVAYFVITIFLALVGIMFFVPFFAQDRVSMREFFGLAPFLFVFFAPAITMRLIAEEKRTGTLEMLITLPVRDAEVVIGKFLAALTLLAVAVALTLPYAFTIAAFGDLDFGPVIGGYVGLLLLGAAFLAVGLAASSFTENQIVAFVLALFVSMLLLMVDRFVIFLPQALGGVVEYLSFATHFRDAARGVIDTRDVVFFLSFALLGLFLAFRSLESRRWR